MTELKMGRIDGAGENWIGSILSVFRGASVSGERRGRGRTQSVPDALRKDVGLKPKGNGRYWRYYR